MFQLYLNWGCKITHLFLTSKYFLTFLCSKSSTYLLLPPPCFPVTGLYASIPWPVIAAVIRFRKAWANSSTQPVMPCRPVSSVVVSQNFLQHFQLSGSACFLFWNDTLYIVLVFKVRWLRYVRHSCQSSRLIRDS